MKKGILACLALLSLSLIADAAQAHSSFFFGFSFGPPVYYAPRRIVVPAPVCVAPPVVTYPGSNMRMRCLRLLRAPPRYDPSSLGPSTLGVLRLWTSLGSRLLGPPTSLLTSA